MHANDLDETYTSLCRTMTGLGESGATLFLARLALLALARSSDAAAAQALIEAAAAADFKS